MGESARHSLHPIKTAFALIAAAVFLAFPVRAQVLDPTEARERLAEIYAERADLQQAFRSDWSAISSARTTGIADLEDWAMQYGHHEYPDLLAWFSPARRNIVPSTPDALMERATAFVPVRKSGPSFDPASVTASSVFVVDVPSRKVLLEHDADVAHPLASVTKLMTGLAILEHGVPMGQMMALVQEDEVGGARLRVPAGTTITVEELMYAMLVGSANNAAHALARASGLGLEGFVSEMNVRAAEMGLANTTFVDPSGLEVPNMSTAKEAAALALEAFGMNGMKRFTTTASYDLVVDGETKKIRNTNDLLTDPDNGLTVLGGKTGYLHESKWNLVVKMMDSRQKPILVVIFGAASKADLFRDARTAAEWVWSGYAWSGAQEGGPVSLASARDRLASVYSKRMDLRQLFRADDWSAVASVRTSGIVDLEDWARQYGHKEHPEILFDYAPAREVVRESSPRALEGRPAWLTPNRKDGATFSPASVTASSVFVVDVPSRKVLLEHDADAAHPLASVTKLMTGMTVSGSGTSMYRSVKMSADDEIGGVRLNVNPGTSLTVQELMYLTLVGSANNTAHALARSSDAGLSAFVAKMNLQADEMGLVNTHFTDPSGLDPRNVSTAKEAAALALEAFDVYYIKKMTTTSAYDIVVDGTTRHIRNTNDLLTDPDNGLTVLGGKTGYLHESKWNLVVKMMDSRQKLILAVIFGAASKADLFRDAETVARWVWNNHQWSR